MDLEVAFEARLGRQARVVEGLDRGEMGLLRGELREDRVARAVAEPMILGVDAEIRPDEWVVGDDPPEAGLDEVVQVGVQRACVGGPLGTGQDDVLQRVGHEFSWVEGSRLARSASLGRCLEAG